MKRLLLVLAVCPLFADAQPLISTDPQNRTVLLEHFTGIYVGEGIQGYDEAMAVYMNDPLEVSIISYHHGAFAAPINNDPDFRTADGTLIGDFYSVQQHPRGVINRRPNPLVYAIPRDDYAAAANTVLNLPSPVNLGMISVYDQAANQLSVDVEILYTANSPGGNDYLSVALVESNVVAFQENFFGSADSAYMHPYLFRTMLAGTWGDEIMTTTAGHTEGRTYIINLDPSWNIANCHVVAFIGEFQDDVYQARNVPADGGSTTLSIQENGLDQVLGTAYPSPSTDLVTIPFFNLDENVTIRVMDVLGRVAYTEQVNQKTEQIVVPVADWAPGIYNYRIISESGEVSAVKAFQVL